MSIETVNAKRGMVLLMKGDLYKVVDTEFRKPGKGRAHMTLKLKNLKNGAIAEQRFSPDDKVELVHIDKRQMEYLYQDSDGYVFMDSETYDQITLSKEFVGDDILYLLPNSLVQVEMYNDRPLGFELPSSVTLTVTETDPALKGATVQAQTKPAVLETGLTVQVPAFVAIGDVIQIGPGGKYQTRVTK